MKRLFQSGFGNVCSWRLPAGRSTWRSMGQILIPACQRLIRLLPRLSVGTVIRFLYGKGGGVVQELTERYGSVVNGIMSMQVTQNVLDTLEIRHELNEVEDQMAEVVDKLSTVVYKSDLSEIMTEFGEPQIKRGYLILNGEPFKADLAYNEIYQQAKNTIFIIDN